MIDAENVIIDFLTKAESADEIYECLKTLYTTPEGTAPLDRDFGLNWDFVDMTIEAAKGKYMIEVIEKTKKYEPRVNVESVSYQVMGVEGVLKPKVVLHIV